MTNKDREKLAVGNIYYKQNTHDCKSYYKVEVVEILNDKEVMVKGMTKDKKGRESKPFKTYIDTLHTNPSKATGGYKKNKKKGR